MPCKPTLSPLAAKLDQLGISVDECVAVCGVTVEVVTDWLENGTDAEGAIRLRWLDDDADALRRVNHLRRSYTRNLPSDAQRREQASNTATPLESVQDGRHYAALAGSPS